MKKNKMNRESGKVMNDKKLSGDDSIVSATGFFFNSLADELSNKVNELSKENRMLIDNMKRLEKERDEAVGKQLQLEALFVEVCKERDWYKKCLESAENALKYKDNVIAKMKKKWKKRVADKDDVIKMQDEEIGYHYKRREKAEKILTLVAESLAEFSEKVKAYE